MNHTYTPEFLRDIKKEMLFMSQISAIRCAFAELFISLSMSTSGVQIPADAEERNILLLPEVEKLLEVIKIREKHQYQRLLETFETKHPGLAAALDDRPDEDIVF
jgi:hypothetical protein